MTTRGEIQERPVTGKAKGATRGIIARDTFDHEDYPVYVMSGQDPKKKAQNLGEMQRE
jgi:hypothetical protein